LHADILKRNLELGQVEFLVPTASKPTSGARINRISHSAAVRPPSGAAKGVPPKLNAGLQLVVKPFAMPLGAASPATASGSFDQDRYDLHVTGDAELARLLNIAQALGVGTPGVGLAGAALVDVDVAGSWVGFAQPVPSGKMQVRNATAELQGVAEPLLIDSAAVTLENQLLNVKSFSGNFAKGTQLGGSASFPVHCVSADNCLLQFDVHADTVSLNRLNELLNPSFRHQPWYRLLAIGKRNEDALMKLHASGHFSTPHLQLGTMTANNINGTLELSSGKLRVHELHAELLGGREDGSWLADFTVSPPRFMGNGVVTKISMAQLSVLTHDNWATGLVDAQFSLSMSGMNPTTLRDSAAGDAGFTWSGGSLRHVTLEGHGAPMTFSSFIGKAELQNGVLTMKDGKLQSGGASFVVKGTASFDRSLDVRLERSGGHSYVISGTLDQPHVQTVNNPAAEASLR
jgi:hypothetical protein